jgi:hypothetical protein
VREAAKSGLVLFHEAIEEFDLDKDLEKQFQRFERAAAKGHEESIWIVSVVKDVEMEKIALKDAFAKAEEPLGWCFAGLLSDDGREKFDFLKKSAEGGCSWGQAEYGMHFRFGGLVQKDMKVYLELIEKAMNQNNPQAMDKLGDWFRTDGGDKEKAVSYFGAAAESGWKFSMNTLAQMLSKGQGCAKDLRQAAIWSAKGSYSDVFWWLLEEAKEALESRATEDLDCDFDQLCYSLGGGLYWHQYGRWGWSAKSDDHDFGNRCLDFYCYCVELQQKSIFTFLLCWNRTTGGIKGPGQMIAKMVWDKREDNLVKMFETSDVAETKGIKK